MAKVGLRAVSGGQTLVGPAASAMICEIGITRLFGSADIATQGLGEGWSACEDGHNWNDGPETEMSLWIESLPTRPLVLTIEGLPYLATGMKAQRSTLYGNGYRLGFWSLTENKVYSLQVVVEPEQWLPRDGGGLLKVAWNFGDSVKPVDVGDAEDHRELGFCFRSLTLDHLAG